MDTDTVQNDFGEVLDSDLACMQTIVQDDEYVSISSANLNQRSLDGSRDTELGMGSWQPAYTLANAQQSQDGGGTASHASAYSDLSLIHI